MLSQDLSALNARFFEGFDPDSADLPILVENQPAEAIDETRPWCRWSIAPGASQAATIGPSALFTQLGSATLQVFVPMGHGIAIGYEIRDQFEALFRGWRSADLRLRAYKISNTTTERNGEPAQISCTIFWESRRAP